MSDCTRRQFLYGCAAALALAALPHPCAAFFNKRETDSGPSDIAGKILPGGAPDRLWKWSREGFDYAKLENKVVVCGICPNSCVLEDGDRSVCRSKVNIGGRLYTLAYGNPCTVNLDPIEKKPLFHFMPETRALSIAAAGCNLRCLNCQNWEISQTTPESIRHIDLFPDQVVNKAKEVHAASIAYTYSEPISYFEYMLDTARKAKEKQVYNLMISNGYINTGPLQVLCGVIDAANINLKSFDDRIYRKLNGGRLQPVLNTLKTLSAKNVHFEITTLVVPGYVDDPKMITEMCRWIIQNLGPDHPLHFLRFFPQYKLDRLAPTPISTLTNCRNIAIKEGIHYVYIGNVPGHAGNNTYCHHCGRLLIERQGYLITEYNLKRSRCRFCRTKIPGVWSADV